MSNHNRVFPGQKLQRPSASFRNDVIDLLDRSSPALRTGDGERSDRDLGSPAIVEIVNNTEGDSAADLPIGELVELSDTTTAPPDETDVFKMLPRRLAKKATEVSEKEDLAVVLSGALKERGAGLAAIIGQFVVRIVPNVVDGEDNYDGEYLVPSATDGAAKFQSTKGGAFARVIRPKAADRETAYEEEANRFCLGEFLVGDADTDCPEFDCGLAVGAALPRTTSTGVLRMFRGQRPNTDAALSKTNRPEKELQIGVGFLGRWPATKTARWMMPGMPPSSASEPDPDVKTYNENSITSNQPELRRHLVTRRHTQNKNGIEFDFSPPGFQGWLYVIGTQFPTIVGSDPFMSISSSNPQHLAVKIYDGLIVAGRWFPHNNSTAMSWNATNASEAIASDIAGNMQTYFDGGCCPKYDAAASLDIYQGPGGFH